VISDTLKPEIYQMRILNKDLILDQMGILNKDLILKSNGDTEEGSDSEFRWRY
jgi:hypothetical protein